MILNILISFFIYVTNMNSKSSMIWHPDTMPL